ncbi:hypothetical protein ANANG_G00086000 [Anguilla anguilla]|uniref:Myeloid-derived growth factor n=2 Tax=Anguilla anguilla TaxID=7936 RepID=A0A9D3MKX8_ANGAN|nr:hypothetical protein ANANG_G00086000 [Anguilla anguilla]
MDRPESTSACANVFVNFYVHVYYRNYGEKPVSKMASSSATGFRSSPALIVCLIFLLTLAFASAKKRTKTVDFDVKPGGVVHTFAAKIKKYECSFTYASQGGTNEQWQMSVGLSDDESHFSCSLWRPQGKSYLFFTQFKAEIKGAKIEHVTAYSQTAVGGLGDVALKEEEYSVGDHTVTQNDGKFRAQLSKLTMIGQTSHDEL